MLELKSIRSFYLSSCFSNCNVLMSRHELNALHERSRVWFRATRSPLNGTLGIKIMFDPLTSWKLNSRHSSVGSPIRTRDIKFVCLFSAKFFRKLCLTFHFSPSFQSQIEQQQQIGTEDKKRTGWPQSVWGRETLGRKTLK